MIKLRENIGWVCCVAVGLLFLAAAAAKWNYMLPLEKDIMAFFSAEGHPKPFARILARLLVGVELALGFTLLQPFWRKRIILPASILLLVGFSGYLASLLGTDVENCGCFGAYLKMGPLASLMKNLFLIATCTVALLLTGDRKGKISIPAAILAFSLAIPFAIPWAPPPEAGRFATFPTFQNAGAQKLNEGVSILAFFSATCEHCMEVAEALSQLPPGKPKVFLAFDGEAEEITAFRQQTGADDLPWQHAGVDLFYSNIGNAPPRVYLLKHGRVIHHWDDKLPLQELLDKIEQLK